MGLLEDDEPTTPTDGATPEEERRRGRGSGAFRLFGELLDPESRLRRGQELMVGTKEELVRIVSSEVRNFLDKMDAVDLLQRVVAGLTVDVNLQVRFSRAADKRLEAEVTRNDASFREAVRPNRDSGDPEPR
jgi:hypothetical protein